MTDNQHLNLKAWSDHDRPREKLLAKGIQALSNSDLLAILLRTGTKSETVVELSRRILYSVNDNLDQLGKLSVSDLKNKFNGVGETKAITIVAALELGRRRKETKALARVQVANSVHIVEIFQPLLSDLPHEEFWILLLNRNNRVIEKVPISKGGVSATVVDIKIIMRTALEKLASSLVLCHNHPSGNIQPSEQDKNLTVKIKKACEVMEIQLLDHIIIAEQHYFSFADEGLI